MTVLVEMFSSLYMLVLKSQILYVLSSKTFFVEENCLGWDFANNDTIFFILLWALSLLTALRLFCYKNKGLKEPTRIRFPSARFKNFVNDLNVTKSFFLGVGLGRSCLEQRQTCRGTEG